LRLYLKSLDAIQDCNLEIVAEESKRMFISCTHSAGEIVRYTTDNLKIRKIANILGRLNKSKLRS